MITTHASHAPDYREPIPNPTREQRVSAVTSALLGRDLTRNGYVADRVLDALAEQRGDEPGVAFIRHEAMDYAAVIETLHSLTDANATTAAGRIVTAIDNGRDLAY